MTRSEPRDTDTKMTRATQSGSFSGVLLRALLPLGILGIGALAYSVLSVEPNEEKKPTEEPKAIRTKVVKLNTIDYQVTVETNGLVQPHNEVTLSAEVGGQITRVSPHFEVGSYFSAGDVLVELDARDYETAVAIANAQYLSAKAALKLATLVYERNLKLFEKNGVSEAEVNQALASQSQASALLDSASAQLEQAERDLERTKIVAPFDGRVRQKDVGVGQTVGAGTPLGIVFTVDFAEVRLPIAGNELQYLELPEFADDAPVDVELRDAINQDNKTVWNAQIVRTEGALDQDSLELFAIARIIDPFGRKSNHPPLRIGQPVVGTIAGNELNDVVAFPRGAVRQLDQVYFVDETELTLSSKTISPVWEDEDYIIVKDPLIEDGQLLSTTRIVYAPDGAKVEIIPDIDVTTATVKMNKTADSAAVAN